MSNNAEKLAFIGLGVMGYPMAGHLQNRAYATTVFNRTAVKAVAWCDEYGGQKAASPAQAAADADVVFICVGADEDVDEIINGQQGIAAVLRPGVIVVDHTTTSAQLARRLAEQLGSKGVAYLDAPVSGGEAGARNGALTIMVGGELEVFNRVTDVIGTYAKQLKLLGPSGSGQLAKMVNQICIAGLVQGLAEGLNFAKNAGLDPAQVVEVISQGAAQSWQMDNRYQTMLQAQYDHGFAVDWMRKDLAYVLAEAQRNTSALPVTELVDQFYGEVQAMGGGRWDTSSLLARLERSKF